MSDVEQIYKTYYSDEAIIQSLNRKLGKEYANFYNKDTLELEGCFCYIPLNAPDYYFLYNVKNTMSHKVKQSDVISEREYLLRILMGEEPKALLEILI